MITAADIVNVFRELPPNYRNKQVIYLSSETARYIQEMRAYMRYTRRFNMFHPGRKVRWHRLSRPQRAAALQAADADFDKFLRKVELI